MHKNTCIACLWSWMLWRGTRPSLYWEKAVTEPLATILKSDSRESSSIKLWAAEGLLANAFIMCTTLPSTYKNEEHKVFIELMNNRCSLNFSCQYPAQNKVFVLVELKFGTKLWKQNLKSSSLRYFISSIFVRWFLFQISCFTFP